MLYTSAYIMVLLSTVRSTGSPLTLFAELSDAGGWDGVSVAVGVSTG